MTERQRAFVLAARPINSAIVFRKRHLGPVPLPGIMATVRRTKTDGVSTYEAAALPLEEFEELVYSRGCPSAPFVFIPSLEIYEMTQVGMVAPLNTLFAYEQKDRR
jgi:hypothetical protein